MSKDAKQKDADAAPYALRARFALRASPVEDAYFYRRFDAEARLPRSRGSKPELAPAAVDALGAAPRPKSARQSHAGARRSAGAVHRTEPWSRKMRIAIVAFAAGMIVAPSLVAAQSLSNEAEIRSVFSGNTVAGEEDGVPYVEYFTPDGRILGENREGRYKGHWRIFNSRMCLAYDEDEGKKGWECSQVGIKGARISWTDDGETTYSTIAPGNPNGL
jgi:hypothetical protein